MQEISDLPSLIGVGTGPSWARKGVRRGAARRVKGGCDPVGANGSQD